MRRSVREPSDGVGESRAVLPARCWKASRSSRRKRRCPPTVRKLRTTPRSAHSRRVELLTPRSVPAWPREIQRSVVTALLLGLYRNSMEISGISGGDAQRSKLPRTIVKVNTIQGRDSTFRGLPTEQDAAGQRGTSRVLCYSISVLVVACRRGGRASVGERYPPLTLMNAASIATAKAIAPSVQRVIRVSALAISLLRSPCISLLSSPYPS